MSVLCAKCEVIQFDESEHNGFVQPGSSGETDLSFKFDYGSERILLDYELRDTFPNLPELTLSASNGCALCALLKTEITNYRGQTSFENKHHTELYIHKLCYYLSSHRDKHDVDRYSFQALLVYFELSHPNGTYKKTSNVLQLGIQADPAGKNPSPWLGVRANPAIKDPCTRWLSIPRQPVERDILSETGIGRLNELKEIAFSVPNLPSVLEHPCLPTRLIDVGFRHSGERNEEPRLVITADYPPLRNKLEKHQYIALSYCWGPPEKALKQLKTETSTLKARLHQIPYSTLPGAHRDAVRLCRALGIRYIWIDSLCIIQDEKADWEREAAQMGSVYANSYLTVCAAQGDSCLDGFLHRSVPTHVINVPFTSSLDPSVSGSYSLFALSPTKDFVQRDIFNGKNPGDYCHANAPPPNPYRWATYNYRPYERDINNSSWKYRGWTFQEFMLSPRILLFGQGMVHVCSGDVLIRSEDAFGNSSNKAPRHLHTERHESAEEMHNLFSDWNRLARDYSNRSLTYANDILPAISSLAKLWAETTGDKYLAGLFGSDLHQSLLWAHQGMRTPAQFLGQDSEDYIAPSWSWASQTDDVTWPWYVQSEFKPEFHLVDSCITPDGIDPYGRVKSGYLVLSTKVCPIPTTRLHRESQFLGHIFPYELLSEDGKVLAHLLFDWRNASVEAPKDPKTGEECEDGPLDQLSMVLTSSKVTEEDFQRVGNIPSQDLLLGLLVLPTGTSGEYRKAGTFFTVVNGPCGREFWNQCSTEEIRLV